MTNEHLPLQLTDTSLANIEAAHDALLGPNEPGLAFLFDPKAEPRWGQYPFYRQLTQPEKIRAQVSPDADTDKITRIDLKAIEATTEILPIVPGDEVLAAIPPRRLSSLRQFGAAIVHSARELVEDLLPTNVPVATGAALGAAALGVGVAIYNVGPILPQLAQGPEQQPQPVASSPAAHAPKHKHKPTSVHASPSSIPTFAGLPAAYGDTEKTPAPKATSTSEPTVSPSPDASISIASESPSPTARPTTPMPSTSSSETAPTASPSAEPQPTASATQSSSPAPSGTSETSAPNVSASTEATSDSPAPVAG